MTPIVGVVMGFEEDVTEADEAFLHIVGYTAEEFAASGRLSSREMTPPEFLHLDEAGVRQARESGGFTTPYQKELFRKDGSRVPVLIVCAFLPDNPKRWIGYVVDLSPRPVQRATFANPRAPLSAPRPQELYGRLIGELVRERTRMLATMDSTSTLFWSVDREFRLLSANQAFQAQQRLVIGRDADLGEMLLGPQYSEALQAEWREWYARALRGERFNARGKVAIDGHPHYYEHVLSPILDPHGSVIGVTVVSQDVTARTIAEEALRESEARFRTLTDASPLGIFLADAAGDCVYANPRLAAMWQLPAEEMRGRGWTRNIHPEDVADVVTRWYAMGAGAGPMSCENRLAFPDGSERHVRIWVAPIQDGEKISGYVGSVEDDTEQRALASRLRDSEKMESLGTLAGGIAHDFNNMLGVVLGYADLALADVEDLPNVQQSLREIRTASLRARDLVRQILTFSRRSEQRHEPVDLRLLTQESLRLLRATLPATVALDVDLPETAVTVLGDATALQQIIVNLCTNAEHAMRESGGGRLAVRLHAEGEGQARRAVLGVRDTGHGMTAEVRARLFDPFFTTKPVGEGTGMGLAVVHGIVAAHGGSITLDSAPGAGASFRVVLPLATTPVPELAATPAVARGSERVLLVEDEPALARFAERALAQAGYQVTRCQDGAEALRRFRAEPAAVDLVVSDVTMPGLTGDRVVREMRLLRPDLPAILMTGFSHTVTAESACADGVAALLQKPFTAQALVAAVGAALEPGTTGE